MTFLSIFDAVTPVINKILDYIPDPQQKLAAQQQLMQGLSQWDSQQAAINQAEASSNSIFVAGWRPFIGWTCGAAFAYKFVLQPFLIFFIVVCGINFDIDSLPALDWSEMGTVLLGMLGMGGLRTFEKMQGISK